MKKEEIRDYIQFSFSEGKIKKLSQTGLNRRPLG